MVNAFEIGVNIIEDVIVFLFLTYYFKPKDKGIKMIAEFILGVGISVGTVTYLNSLYIYEGFLGLIFIVIFFLYAQLFLQGDVYTKLFISGFINCILYFIALLSILFTSLLFKTNSNQYFLISPERIVGIIFSKVVLIAVCLLLLKFKFKNILKRNNMVVLIILPIVTMLSIVGIMQIFLRYNELKSELLLATISIMMVNVLTYYMFIRINHDVKTETELNALQQKYENDKKYAEDIEELYLKTCSIRHDILQHFTALRNLVDNNPNKAKAYIDTVTKNQLEEIKRLVKTDNDCFNAIVNTKIETCNKLNIKVAVRVMNNVLNRLRDDEIAVIFGNLFDNAIEATKNAKHKNIELDVQMSGGYLSVMMSNSIDNSVLEYNNSLNTTKQNKDHHGFGTKNIQKIVEGHQGMIEYFEKDGFFYCDIYI